MQLQVNKYYKTRSGRKAYILGRHPGSSAYPWIGYIEGEDAIRRWTDDGNYSMSGGNARDLVTEWHEPPTVGSDSWALALPIGTKIRWHTWGKGEYIYRTDGGWKQSTHKGYHHLCAPGNMNRTGWLLYTEPELRPWNNVSEVPIDAIFRRKLSDNQHWYRCLGVATNLAFPVSYGLNWESFEVVFRTMDHSTDGGKTWLPCGVEE